MDRSGWDTARQALEVARSRGFQRVKVEAEGVRFSACFGISLSSAGPQPESESAASPRLSEVCSPAVGYFREKGEPLEPGRVLAEGEAVGEVVALGIANEVVSPVAGTVESVEVAAGDVVDFGKVIAQVRPL